MTQRHPSSAARPLAALAAAALAALALAASPAPAAAETYTIKLVDGGEFLSRYQPQEASWDADQILFLTEFGNWIAVGKDELAGITTATENKGYGRVINTTTIALGWAPNDAEVPGEEGEGEPPSSADLLREFLSRPEKSYDIQQFVEPGEAGGGLPVTYGVGVGGAGTQ
jgi:hypothetical protein